jgi:ABC-type transport system involved in multi-copper enzyme maturation permease subunit
MSDSLGSTADRYRGWSQQLRPPWFVCWSIARTGLQLALRRKLFWFLLGVALLNFLFLFAAIYLKAQLSVQNPAFKQFIDGLLSSVSGSGKTYRDFMFAQGTVTMLMLAFAGELLVGNDYRHGGLTFYLSRRVGRRHYVVGKLLGIGLLVELTTTVPTLVLYAEYGLLTDSTVYFQGNLRILFGILGYGLIMAVGLSLLLFALAAWLQRTVPLVMSWSCIFLLLPILGEILRHVHDDRRWRLLMYWRDIRLLGSWCFGALDPGKDEPLVLGAVVVVAAVCLVSVLAVIPRVRAVRVVS